MEDIVMVNIEDKDYYDKLFKVSLWPGAGYELSPFKVYANHEEQALEILVAYLELNNMEAYITSIEDEFDMIHDDYEEEYAEFVEEHEDSDEFAFAQEWLLDIYIDATMEGASQPYFLTGENLNIEDITGKKEEAIKVNEECTQAASVDGGKVSIFGEKEKKEEYYIKPEDEHIIWDSEDSVDDYDMDEMKDIYQDYVDNFNSEQQPMEFDKWLDSDDCANYFDFEWEEAAKENSRYAEWADFIIYYVSDEEKEEAYNEYVERCKNTTLTPDDFETWFDNYRIDMSDEVWNWKEDDLKENIFPEIDKQLNDDILLLSGNYGSNYADFRPSGEGGVMFEKGTEEFRQYMGNFDRVCITTQNGVLGAICNDHDGTISGQFFTLPDDKSELIKAMGYDKIIKERYDEEDLDKYNENDLMETEFNNDIYYGGIDTSDLNKYIDLLKPIKDTISGYAPTDPMIMANEKGGTILKPVKVKKTENAALDEDDEETLEEAINRAHQEEISAIDTYDTVLSKTDDTTDTKLIDMINEIKADEEDHKLLLQHYIETGEALTDDELEELKNKSSNEDEPQEKTLEEAKINNFVDKWKDHNDFKCDWCGTVFKGKIDDNGRMPSCPHCLEDRYADDEEKFDDGYANKDVHFYDTEKEDEIYTDFEGNIVESKCIKEELDNSTITEELNTGTLPVLDVGLYGKHDFIQDLNCELSDIDPIIMDMAPAYIQRIVSKVLPSVQIKAISVYHPKQYNYSDDELEFTLTCDRAEYETLKENALNSDEFITFLKDNYKSYDGFVSYLADNIDEFKTQEEWKQIVQVIMFALKDSEATIDEVQDEYSENFYTEVTAKFEPYNEELDESKQGQEQKETKWDKLVGDVETVAEKEGFTLTSDDVYSIVDSLINEEDISDDVIVAAIEKYPNKVEETKNKKEEQKTLKEVEQIEQETDEYAELDDEALNTDFKVGDVVQDYIDNDYAVIEEIDDNKKSGYLLRFTNGAVQGVAYWYKKGRFTKVTDENTIKEVTDMYNRLKAGNNFRAF